MLRKRKHWRLSQSEKGLGVQGKSRVVHVVRPKEVEETRKDLPIVMMEQEIMEAINENSVVIVCGETGCGKTTQLPQFLYEAGFSSNHQARSCIIGVAQPRRVAVLSSANRVEEELGLKGSKAVGYQVRHQKCVADIIAIKFMTDGILLQELKSDFLLSRYSVIILDEAHERSANSDILIGLLSRSIQLRQKVYDEQQKMILSGQNIIPEQRISPPKLILMSATMRVKDFISAFGYSPPIIEVPTRQFPITVHFAKRTDINDYVGQAFKKVLSIHRNLPKGGILVFVTGQREVEELRTKLLKASKKLFSVSTERNSGNNEAFEIQGNSVDQLTDEFSYYDEDMPVFDGDESDSYDSESESESELEIVGGDGDWGDDSIPKNDTNILGVLGEERAVTSLKTAFEALDGNSAVGMNCKAKQNPLMPQECLNNYNQSAWKKDKRVAAGPLRVLSLYAMLSEKAQLRVFEEVKKGERLVVVATNVAETSLTIPGIKYVVDTGKEKVKDYDPSNGMASYKVQWISKASAAQRAGRAGRTGPGHCYRLYSSAVFNDSLAEFSCPEILKVPLEGYVLNLESMNIKVHGFPFPTCPRKKDLDRAYDCLRNLKAFDGKRLTPLGKAMACYPMDPRHSRILLTAVQIINGQNYSRANLVLGYAVAAAAALSLSNPFLMQLQQNSDCSETEEISGELEPANIKRTAKEVQMSSDVLTVAYCLQCFEVSKNREKFCSENTLHKRTMDEMSKLREQLLGLFFDQNSVSWTHGTIKDVKQAWKGCGTPPVLNLYEETALSQAICAGLIDRVAKRVKNSSTSLAEYEICTASDAVFLHPSSSPSHSAPEYLVYSELVHTKRRPHIHGATSIDPKWLVDIACETPICTNSVDKTRRPFYNASTDQVYRYMIPSFGYHRWELPAIKEAVKDDGDRIKAFAYALLEGDVLPCLKPVRDHMAARPSSLLERQGLGDCRVENFLRSLMKLGVDSCATLRREWNKDSNALKQEFSAWIKRGYQSKFEALWSQMHCQVQLDYDQRFPNKAKKKKRKTMAT
ncbi:ATP-dependent RNA helicase DEAH13-like isoform X2 [Mercurialis annua]|uniref:ATP-dependent RNA helicase DEAH13-like isoform X2 n=1 Tax=Mercurialis annua TaxID=3986 RepID=UPI002160F6C7|nr:ATP-dependent RNA helicase DEAH13-like isoform X2 [Mercurialis annua]XP_055960034.1 ATP-dependent RNA helicase DEAH13-like isoform X2 [Mercurialis annua]